MADGFLLSDDQGEWRCNAGVYTPGTLKDIKDAKSAHERTNVFYAKKLGLL